MGGWTSAPSGRPPLPPGQLLRSGGGGGFPVRRARPRASGASGSAAPARRILERDVATVLAARSGAAVPGPWRHPRFAARVRATRLQLAQLLDPRLLAASFAREALHARRPIGRPGAVRVAYAIRWLEIADGVVLPPWPAWTERTAG